MSSKYDSMGKTELRAACKAAGISYGKLDNAGMRASLAKKDADFGISDKPKTTEAPVSTPAPVAAAPVVEEKPAAPVVTAPPVVGAKGGKTAGMKIEKDREEKNGVKRPSVGGMCRAVWDALDAIKASGKDPVAKDVTDLAAAKGWNKNNASIEFYQWRKFNGITGRSKKAE